MAPPSSVPANAAAVAVRGGSECRICPNHRLTAVAGVRPTPSFYPFILFILFIQKLGRDTRASPCAGDTGPPPSIGQQVRGRCWRLPPSMGVQLSEFRVRASRAGCVIGPFLFAVKQRRADSGAGVDPYATSSALTDREVALSWSSWKSS